MTLHVGQDIKVRFGAEWVPGLVAHVNGGTADVQTSRGPVHVHRSVWRRDLRIGKAPVPAADPSGLTPGQLAARKAVETRKAREAARAAVVEERKHEDATIRPSMCGRGVLMLVAGVCWTFGTREAALDYARRSGFNVVR